MSVIVFVAGEAVRLQLHFEDRFDVTGDALFFCVHTVQRVAGGDTVIEVHFGPAAAGVTGIAVLAAMPVMMVVFEVTADAGRVEFIGERVFGVATFTALFGVFAIDHEVGVTIVIETRVFPALGVMAVAALIATAAVVRIIFRVTVVTGGRCVLKRIVCMTAQAAWLLVLADQRVIGRTVIEFHVEPLDRGMAVAALRA